MLSLLRRLLRTRLRLRSGRVRAFLLFVLLLWYVSAAFLYFELPGKPDLNWLDAVWWSMVTMATVGYGDLFPVSVGGRLLAGVPAMLFGIGFLGYLISEAAAALLDARSRKARGMAELRCTDHVLIVNFNGVDMLTRLVRELRGDPSTGRRELVLVDQDLPELPRELAELGLLFVKGDPAVEETLTRAALDRAWCAILLARDPADPRSDDRNLAVALVIETLRPEVRTVVEVVDGRRLAQFRYAGTDSVVCASELRASLLVQEVQDPGVQAIVQDLTSNTTDAQFYIMPIKSMKDWRYGALNAWALARGYAALGLQRGAEQRLCPAAGDEVRPGDRVILVGRTRPAEVEA